MVNAPSDMPVRQPDDIILTPGRFFIAHIGRFTPVGWLTSPYLDASSRLEECNNDRSVVFPIAALRDGVGQVMEQLAPLVENTFSNEQERYRQALRKELTEVRDHAIKERCEILRQVEGRQKTISDQEALTALTPEEEKQTLAVWEEAKNHPETQLLLARPFHERAEKPYHIVVAPPLRSGKAVGGSAYLHLNTALIHRHAEKTDEIRGKNYYRNRHEANLLHENAHLLGQGHSPLFADYRLREIRKKLTARLEALAGDEMERSRQDRPHDFDAPPRSLYMRWLQHREPDGWGRSAKEIEEEIKKQRNDISPEEAKDDIFLKMLEKDLEKARSANGAMLNGRA